MKPRIAFAVSLLAAVCVMASAALANQVTILPSTSASFQVSNSFGSTSIAAGTGLSGNATFPDVNPFIGTYSFWFGNGSMPTLSLNSPHNYDVSMGSASLWLQVCIQTCNGVNPGEFIGIVTVQKVSNFDPRVPQVSGYITITSSSGMLAAEFPVNSTPVFDVTFTNIKPSYGIDYVYQHPGTNVSGSISSGQIVPGVPEPGTLVMMGTGLLGMAGFLRRRR